MCTSSVLLLLLSACSGDESTEDSADSVVENQAPSAPEVQVSPADPLYGEELLCAVTTESVDPEGDELSYSYSWTVDGEDAGLSSETVNGTFVQPWQTWSCSVVASDGELDSEAGVAQVTSTDECVSVTSTGQQTMAPMQQTFQEFTLGNTGGSITLEGWFRLDDPGAGTSSMLFYKGDYGSPNSYTLDYMIGVAGGTRALHWATGSSGNGTCTYVVVDESIEWGQWFHVAGVYDGPTGTKQLFLNGELISDCQEMSKSGATVGPLTIGGHMQIDPSNGSVYPSRQLRGNMDEVRVSSTVRYTADFTPSTWLEADADTLGLWHFSEGSGQTTDDASGNGYTGQLFTDQWSAEDSACEGYLTLTE